MTIHYDKRDDHIVVITIDRPEARNALDMYHFRDLANATDYGLGASVQTNDVKRAIRVSRAVRAGSFGINGYTVMPNLPFGGYKTSGLGREGGVESIEGFLETKTVTMATGDQNF